MIIAAIVLLVFLGVLESKGVIGKGKGNIFNIALVVLAAFGLFKLLHIL